MVRRSWAIAERLSLPWLLAGLLSRGAGTAHGLIEETISFGDDPAQHVLVIRSEHLSAARPLVYFIHGGSWKYGDPELFRAVGRFFAHYGYTTALGGYRLVPRHLFPAQRDDVFAGISAVMQEGWFADACDGSVLLAGQSAGGHLAALAAFDEDSRADAGLGDLDIAGVLAVSGVLDFSVLCPAGSRCQLVENLMGGREGWEHADPAFYVHGSPRVPVLCLHGSRDPLVPVEVAASFVLRANGSEGDHAVFMADPDAHHSDMTRLFFGTSPLTGAMLDWMGDL
ncbi:MAG: alpha/beta hydrolase [Coriobacteriia bacterium]|nr:alpha/beta hydrolase [Coriobacteriia bacterium]